MKRVAALYRVSTKKQVDLVKDDIPMQRISCNEFAKRQGWEVVIEKEEKGVSGFKVSASKRDAIQELKDSALKGEFDVLLVFMFDRLGRIESETPFILEWFTNHGIEVWSVNEGEQRMETHVDKLMNYIRFWQASGESEKTSIRVQTRHRQMTSEGIYTGGPVPFGYMLVDNGRLNKKGKPALDLAINPDEDLMHRDIFSKFINEGYGTHQLAAYVNSCGFKTRHGRPFTSSGISRILHNEISRGFLVRCGVRSERIPELQIITDQEYERVLEIMEQRNGKNEEKRTIALSNRGKALLSGNVFCAHCGCHLTGSRRAEVTKHVDGTERRTYTGIYVCYHRSRRLNDCDGATVYVSSRVDDAVLKVARYLFANISGCPEEEKIKEAYQNSVEYNLKEQQKIKAQLAKDQKQLGVLQLEIANCLTGDSVYSSEDLSVAIKTIKERISNNEARLSELESEQYNKKKSSESVVPAYRQFKTWAEEFDSVSFQAKKMIVNQLFSRIEVGKDYKINCVLNMTYKQFCEEWVNV